MTIAELLTQKLYAVGAREYLTTQDQNLTVEEWLPTCRHASTMMDLMLLLYPALTLAATKLMLTASEHNTPAYHAALVALIPDATPEEARVTLVESVEQLVVQAIRDLSFSEDWVTADDRQVYLCNLMRNMLPT